MTWIKFIFSSFPFFALFAAFCSNCPADNADARGKLPRS
jgi:hypothetical protein